MASRNGSAGVAPAVGCNLWPPHHRCPRSRPETCTHKRQIPIFRKSATDLDANYTHGAGDVHSTHTPLPSSCVRLTVKGEGHRAGSLAATSTDYQYSTGTYGPPQRPAIGSMCWERLIRQYPHASFTPSPLFRLGECGPPGGAASRWTGLTTVSVS